jgi:hypothetical protein
MRKLFLLAVIVRFMSLPVFSQETDGGDPSPRGNGGAVDSYLLPQTIFVGDRGRLVKPLGQAYMAARPFVYAAPDTIPPAEDMVISRIELEHRNGSARLLIDFIPYVPGTVSFPPVIIPIDGSEPLTVTGLTVQVASILRPQEASLSGFAAPLTVPGTGIVVYGAAAVVLVFLLAAAGMGIWGRKHFTAFRERFRKRRLLRAMARYLRRLGAESNSAGIFRQGELFSELSGEFREFLSLFTGINCRALTPSELGGIHAPAEVSGMYLCDLFRRWEILRFSGKKIGREDLSAVLDEVRGFIISLDKAERAAS